MAQLSATHIQRYDEQGEVLGPLLAMDPAVLAWTVAGDSGVAEGPFYDGVYRAMGHVGNFVFGLQRVRPFPGLATIDEVEPVPPSQMGMAALGRGPLTLEESMDPLINR